MASQAIQPTLSSILAELQDLKATVARQDEKIAALEATQDIHAENQLIQLRLIGQLREAAKKEPQPLQRDRGEILRALLVANGGKMLATDARKKMHLSRPLFSMFLATMRDEILIKPYHLHKNWLVLELE